MSQLRSLDISTLDFDEIKQNLKTFLENQSEFTDYDFEGSGLSVLLDILAYNTHYNAYIANMLANETFLDSAVKRSSAVSISKHLGYTPTSTRSARAVLNLTVNNPPGSPDTITLEQYTPFSVSLDGTNYSFYNLESKTITKVNNQYVLNNLEVVEGTPFNIAFVVATPGPDEKYEIPSTTVDTTTIKVDVQTSASNTSSALYTQSTDITGVNTTSTVYFLEENPSERYQIFFGDGVLGKKLTTGNIVNVRYLSSSGAAPNSSNLSTQSFSTTSVGGTSNVTVTAATNPYGGAAKENIESIKFNASRINAARNRAVTAADYEALIKANFTDAESVSVWGGEDNEPPIYGKVLIALKPFDGFTISQTTKNNIINSILSSKKVLAIQPEFVDPNYTYVNLAVNITYNSALTTKTASEIESIVRTTISSYFSTSLQKFNADFNKALLTKQILDSDSSISTVIIIIKAQKRFSILLNVENSFVDENTIKFENSIVPGSLTSSRFFINQSNTITNVKITDLPDTMPPDNNGTGTIRIVNSSTNAVITPNVGTISYSTGSVVINSITPVALPNTINDFRLTATIQETSHNLQAQRNTVLVIDNSSSDVIAGVDAGLKVNVTAV